MKPAARPTVHVIDDDEAFRRSLARLLEASGYRVRAFGSGAEFLAGPAAVGPGCILLDLQFPGSSGLELQAALARAAPLLPVVFLTGHGDIGKTVLAIKGGAEDFLEKTAPTATLLAAISRAVEGYHDRLRSQARTAELTALVDSLTARERTVFDLVVRGKRNKEVAFALGTSERTVKAHRKSIMEKLKVHSLAEAVSIAERLRLLELGDGEAADLSETRTQGSPGERAVPQRTISPLGSSARLDAGEEDPRLPSTPDRRHDRRPDNVQDT